MVSLLVVSQNRWPTVAPIPNEPSMVLRWTARCPFEPSDSLGQSELAGKDPTVREQMPACPSRVVVDPQQHRDYTQLWLCQLERMLNEGLRLIVRRVGDHTVTIERWD